MKHMLSQNLKSTTRNLKFNDKFIFHFISFLCKSSMGPLSILSPKPSKHSHPQTLFQFCMKVRVKGSCYGNLRHNNCHSIH